MKTSFEIVGLSIGYGGKTPVTVASDIGLAFNKGELAAIVGANGSGKSTFLRTVTGMQPALSGSVKIDGNDLSRLSKTDLSKMLAVVLTDKIPAAELTVFELVALGRQPYTNWLGALSPDDRAKTYDALHQAGVAHLRDKKYYELSDGQLQNVLLARALAQDTEIIVLDEPTTHLDLPRKTAVFSLLRQLASDGRCIVFSTHDIELAYAFADSLVLFSENGVESGTPRSLAGSGALGRLFAADGIGFDSEKVKFVYNGLPRDAK
jgi:iron complex transport system ATP-binding protein